MPKFKVRIKSFKVPIVFLIDGILATLSFFVIYSFASQKDAEVQSWKDGTMVVKLGKLEQQLTEKDKEIEKLKSKEKKIRLHTKRDWFERCCRLEYKSISLGLENIDLKKAQNQTAIAELNNILDTFAIFVNEEKESMVSPDGNGNLSLLEYIEKRIDTLKGDSKC